LWSLEGVVSGEGLDDRVWGDFTMFSCVGEMETEESRGFDVADRLMAFVEKLDLKSLLKEYLGYEEWYKEKIRVRDERNPNAPVKKKNNANIRLVKAWVDLVFSIWSLVIQPLGGMVLGSSLDQPDSFCEVCGPQKVRQRPGTRYRPISENSQSCG
jgi:hypothetical protein